MTVLALAISCKETKKENSPRTENTNETVNHDSHDGSPQELGNSWVNEIVLDNGIKWRANKETTDNVLAMLKLVDQNRASTTDDYKKLGNSLNEVKNTLIKECTMEGASDDNLHVWLHPLIEKIELLQNTEDTGEGAQLVSNIKTHVEGYFDYFN